MLRYLETFGTFLAKKECLVSYSKLKYPFNKEAHKMYLTKLRSTAEPIKSEGRKIMVCLDPDLQTISINRGLSIDLIHFR